MSADTLSRPLAHAEEEDRRQHLLLDPRPQEEMNRMVMDSMHRTGKTYWLVVGLLGAVAVAGFLGSWLYMIRWGMGVTGLGRPVYWGIFIASFIFWIGISHSGTFVSAILRVFKAEFRRPITRAAEIMTSVSLIIAVAFLGMDIGRVWRAYWIVPYPNQRGLWPNFHSPFLWDELAILSYLVGSTLYVFMPLIPDLAMARDRSTGWRQRLYRTLSFGWRGTEREWHNLQTAIRIFAFAIIPIMFSVHTIVSWDLAMTKVIGWRSSIFGAYFIVGAIYSGLSAVICILFLVRYNMKLHYFVRQEHFESLAKLLFVFSFVWVYFFFSDYHVEWYGGDAIGHEIINIQLRGQMTPFWYAMVLFNIAIPWLTLWSKRVRRSPVFLFLVCVGISIGMYLERYIIVTGFLRRNRLPFNWGAYTPSWAELFMLIGSGALFLCLYALISRLFPMIPVWEVREGQLAHTVRQVGKAKIPSVAELE
ncbi:MAG: polysulfide reductase NrfD [Chloroflexi bacterium]|nr:polysulfide reductase NrfD [Chloroflexota bacterium]